MPGLTLTAHRSLSICSHLVILFLTLSSSTHPFTSLCFTKRYFNIDFYCMHFSFRIIIKRKNNSKSISEAFTQRYWTNRKNGGAKRKKDHKHGHSNGSCFQCLLGTLRMCCHDRIVPTTLCLPSYILAWVFHGEMVKSLISFEYQTIIVFELINCNYFY